MRKYRRSYQIKRKIPIYKNRFILFSFLALIIFGGIFYLICFVSFFQIKEIEISGQQKVSIEDVRRLIEKEIEQKILFFPTKSIFLTNLNEINKIILENFIQIHKVNLKKKFPHSLTVIIEERKPVAVLVLAEKENENYFLIDKNGIIFERVFEILPEILKIKKLNLVSEVQLGKKIVEENILSQILVLETKMTKDLKIPLKEITIISDERLNAKTFEGWEVYFNPKEDLNWQITKLKVVLENKIPIEKRKNLQYIDLRFEKVFIFPKDLFNFKDEN